MATKPLSPLRSMSKSREVFQQLRDAIWSGEFQPGAPLRESHLAKQLGVSQVPVREALLQLEHLGLVVRVPDRGTTVTQLSSEEMQQMLDVRRHLEEYAFQLAATKIDKAVEAELRQHLTRMRELVAEKNYYGVAQEDFAFHQTVWHASGNEVLEKTLSRLCVAVYAFVSMRRHAVGDAMATAVKSHTTLFHALMTGKQTEIRNAIRTHLAPEAVYPAFVKE